MRSAEFSGSAATAASIALITSGSIAISPSSSQLEGALSWDYFGSPTTRSHQLETQQVGSPISSWNLGQPSNSLRSHGTASRGTTYLSSSSVPAQTMNYRRVLDGRAKLNGADFKGGYGRRDAA